MNDSYSKIMAGKSDTELRAIIENKHKYEPEAYIAAIEALETRQLASHELIQLKLEMIGIEKQKYLEATSTEAKSSSQEKKSWHVSLDLLKVTKEYFYTPIIIYINILVWLVMVLMGVSAFEPSVDALITWGGNLSTLTLDGQPWRLVTNIFVHGGIFHLLLNMYALLQVGAILEIKFGKHRYALTYIATGILASIASIAFHDNIVSVGASGAIFGLFGLFLSLLITKSLDIPHESRKNFISSTMFFILYNLVFGFAKEGIDNAAHIGGLISGLLIGFIYYPSLKEKKWSLITSYSTAAFVGVGVLLAPHFITNPYREFRSAMELFSVNEERALWMYKENIPDSKVGDVTKYNERLQTEGIDLWNKNLSILNTLTNVPSQLSERIELLKTYCHLRIQLCETMQQELKANGAINQDSVSAVNLKLEEVINKIKALD